MARIFMTGATGSIGSQILPLLSKKNTIRALTQGPPLKSIKNVEWVVGDIRRTESYFSHMQGCDVLLHLAAEVTNHSTELSAINVDATRELVLSAWQNGIRKIIVFSSASVSKKNLTPYSESKMQMEKMLKELHIPMIILRPTLVYYLNSRYVQGMEKYCHLPLPFIPLPDGDLSDLRPIHVNDIGKSVEAILEKPFPTKTVIYDLASEKSFTFEDAIRMIVEKKGMRKPIIHFPSKQFGMLYDMLGRPTHKPFVFLSQLAAAGESYAVDPKPFVRKYGIHFTDPQQGFKESV